MEFVKSHVSSISARASRLRYFRSPWTANGLREGRMKTFQRALAALPLLGLCIVAYHVMSTRPAVPFARVLIDSGEIVWDDGKRRVPILNTFYSVHWIDETITVANMFFIQALYGYDAASRTQTVSFLADGGVVLAIWWLESFRSDTKIKRSWYLQYPSMIALAGQVIGLGVVAPLYSFLSLLPSPPTLSPESLPSHQHNPPATVSTPLLSTRNPSPCPSGPSSTSSSPSRGRTANPFNLLPIPPKSPLRSQSTLPRQTPSAVLLPALILAYYLPAGLMLFHPAPTDRQAWLFVWQLFPVYVALANFLFSHIPLPGAAKRKRRSAIQRLDAEVRGTRVCIGVLVMLGAGVWWWTWAKSLATDGLTGMLGLFMPRALPVKWLPNLGAFASEFLRWDEVFVFVGVLAWLAYLYVDLGALPVPMGWLGVFGAGSISLLLLGPGATVGLAWLWREEVLFKRREKHVLMLEVEAKVEALLKASGA